MKWLFTTKAKKRMQERFQREDQVKFDAKMDAIKHLANKNMKKAEVGRFFPVRDHVVVSYDDLLKIWDIADRAKMGTPVQRAHK